MELALRLGNKHLPVYASRFSRHDFTLPQLFACLVLRQFYKLDYRALEGLLDDSPDLRKVIGLTKTPGRSTLCDAFGKIASSEHFVPMLEEIAQAFNDAGLLKLHTHPAAVDSSMFESRHVSRHFERRQRDTAAAKTSKTKTTERYSPAFCEKVRATVTNLPKLTLVVAAGCHLILSAHASTGCGSDHVHAEKVITAAWWKLPVKQFVADAGYDAEKTHQLVRQDLSCDLIVPAIIGCSDAKPPRGPWRRAMFNRFKTDPATRETYGQRWQVETTFSMLKRNFGSALRARTNDRRERELLLKVITHNIAV
jgi:hypothetical protein